MPDTINVVGNNSSEALRGFIERVERLEEERKDVGADIRDVYAEAKAAGFNVKTMRRMVQLRRMTTDARQEMLSLEETYLQALGLL
jgi:uncharacterized protein (UPF0335 family)